MKRIPFYANDEDNMHCMVSVYRMLFDYFLHQQVSQEEMEEYVGFADGRAAWTIKPITMMAKQGFDIRMIEPFDYKIYAKKGDEYLDQVYSREKAAWLREHTNIEDIKPFIPDFLHVVKHENRQANLSDIDDMLADNRLVFVTLNSKVLAEEKGYAEHAVLVLQREGDGYSVHNPGLPPEPNQHISREMMWQAMGGDNHTAEVTGFVFRKGGHLRRLDMYVLAQKPRLSRAFAAKLIEQGKVLVNGKPSKTGHKVQPHDVVTIDYDEAELDIIPKIDLPIIYEDDYCIVINKPTGVLTHAQGALVTEATVATFIRNKVTADIHGQRAGIVHRLDRATSGVMIIAKNASALAYFQEQFAARTTQKTYIAIVEGHITQKLAVIDMPIERNPKAPATFRVGVNGKPATTQYMVVKESDTATLVELKPKTGRTHQLRVHMAHIGHPIVGDPLYGHGAYQDRLFLHAKSLEITLPNGDRKTFEAPLPPEFETYMS